jgi:anti-sigma factor RsiW
MSHLDAGILHALLDGEIPSSELPPIQAHLADCAECRARLEQERQLFAEAEGLVEALEVPAGGAVESVTRRRQPRWGQRLAWAASVIAATGLGYAARGALPPASEPQGKSQISAVQSDSPAAPPAAPLAGVPDTQGPPQPLVAREVVGSGRAANQAANQRRAEPPSQKSTVAAERTEAVVATAPAPPDSSAKAAAGPREAPPAVGALRSRMAAPGLRDESFRLDRTAGAVAEVSASKASLAPPESISYPDAVRRLGGSLRQIEGLVPLRLEAQGASVRVVYALDQGELILSQQLIDGRLEYRLIPPVGFPADSLARLRARVRD